MSYLTDSDGVPLDNQGEIGLVGDQAVIADLRRQLAEAQARINVLERIAIRCRSVVDWGDVAVAAVGYLQEALDALPPIVPES